MRCEACELYHLVGALVGVLHAAKPCGEAQVFAHVHVEVQRVVFGQVAYAAPHLQGVVEDAVSAHRGVAVGGGYEAGEYLHQRRFAGAVGAQQAHNLALLDAEGGMVYGALFAVQFADVFDFYHLPFWFFCRRALACSKLMRSPL